MYLTRMELNVNKRETMKALASPSMIHGAVENAFQGERKRRLWRIDCLDGKWFLMIVSEERPDLKEAVKQFGMQDLMWETKDYRPLLDRIQDGGRWHFRLTANPTVSRMDQRGKETETAALKTRGKVYAHQTAEQQEQWLIKRASRHGFALEKEGFCVVHQEWFHFKKKSQEQGLVSIAGVTFEGVLTVTDADLFRKALCDGIGREKAYGMGMLTVADPLGREYCESKYGAGKN